MHYLVYRKEYFVNNIFIDYLIAEILFHSFDIKPLLWYNNDIAFWHSIDLVKHKQYVEITSHISGMLVVKGFTREYEICIICQYLNRNLLHSHYN